MNPKTSQDLFNKIRSQFSNIQVGDESGVPTADPSSAVFFEFEFKEDADTYGAVSISLADGENMKVFYNRNLVDKIDEDSKDEWYAFLKELKDFAVEHQLAFDVRDITKSNLTKQDYQNLADTNKTVNTDEMSEELNRITKLAGVEEAPIDRGAPADKGRPADPETGLTGGVAPTTIAKQFPGVDDKSSLVRAVTKMKSGESNYTRDEITAAADAFKEILAKDPKETSRLMTMLKGVAQKANPFNHPDDWVGHGMMKNKDANVKGKGRGTDRKGTVWGTESVDELNKITKLAGVAESLTGTARRSYEDLEKTRLIVRHSGKVDEEIPGSRSRHIESLYIENEDGERFKYPLTHLAGARAMQRHVANGGRPHDEFGEHIVKTSEDIAKLNSFSRYVSHKDQLNDNAGDIIEKTKLQLENLREYIRNISKQPHYEAASKDFKTSEEIVLDDETIAKLREKFTLKNLDNRVEDALPLINKIMSELEAPKEDDGDERAIAAMKVARDEGGKEGFEYPEDGTYGYKAERGSGDGPMGTTTNITLHNRETNEVMHIKDLSYLEFSMETKQETLAMIWDENKDQITKEEPVTEDSNRDDLEKAYMLAVRWHEGPGEDEGQGDGNYAEDLSGILEDYYEKTGQKPDHEQIERIINKIDANTQHYADILQAEGINGKIWLELAKKHYGGALGMKINEPITYPESENVTELDPGDEPIDAPVEPAVDHAMIVKQFLANPDSKIMLNKNMPDEKKFNVPKASPEDARIMTTLSDIASRMLTKTPDEDRVANFASRVADQMSKTGMPFDPEDPDANKNRDIAKALVAKYDKASEEIDPAEFNPKKDIKGKPKGETAEFEDWVDDTINPKESMSDMQDDRAQVAQDMWNDSKDLQAQFKTWQEYMDSEDFEEYVSHIMSKYDWESAEGTKFEDIKPFIEQHLKEGGDKTTAIKTAIENFNADKLKESRTSIVESIKAKAEDHSQNIAGIEGEVERISQLANYQQ